MPASAPVSPRRVLIAGAGVAGLESMLALTELAGERVELSLLAPGDRFVYRPLLVTEPFGGGSAATLEIATIVDFCGARRIRGSLASVDAAAKLVTTASGERLEYDSLLVALGARPVTGVPGALTFADRAERRAFAALLSRLGRRGTKRLAFVVPRASTWSLAAYELALLTAGERSARRLAGVELSLITHEQAPLQVFGEATSALVASRLAEGGIELRASARATRFADHRVELEDGSAIEADAAVALPRLVGPAIAGLPRTADGFLPTDVQMHVHGLEDVLAAGDSSSFPIKQGGLAAQQAETAARAIAARAGVRVPFEPFEPVLRAALITGGAVQYLRRPMHERGRGDAAEGTPLWSPPAKVAGQRLAAFLTDPADAADRPGAELVDVAPGAAPSASETRPAVEVLLAAADADAELGEYASALHWLDLVEGLDFVLPAIYVARRDQWRRRLDPSAAPGEAARRVDPELAGAAAALSDLQRRLGWLREIERRNEGVMGRHLADLGDDIERVLAQSKRAGTLE